MPSPLFLQLGIHLLPFNIFLRLVKQLTDAIPKVRQQIALLATSVSVVILLVFLNAGTFLLNFAALSLVLSFSYKIEAKVNDLFFVAFTRIFGIMVAAIAIQFMVEGLGEIFPAWLKGPSPIKDNLEK